MNIVQDVALAMVSMRPIPFPPAMEKITLTSDKYGSVRRFYIETVVDHALPFELQQNMINLNPPEQVSTLTGRDHSPFFSKPQSLDKTLVDIRDDGCKVGVSFVGVLMIVTAQFIPVLELCRS